jgi:secreted trypsin-like serine protease
MNLHDDEIIFDKLASGARELRYFLAVKNLEEQMEGVPFEGYYRDPTAALKMDQSFERAIFGAVHNPSAISIAINTCAKAKPRYYYLQGDLGAPLVSEQTLIGILSYGLGCESNEYPGVYTRVSSYLPWIFQNSGVQQ